MKIKKILLLLYLCFAFQNIQAQVCGNPGKDGVPDRLRIINTYFFPANDMVLAAGSRQIMLSEVGMGDVFFYDYYGNIPISPGDLLMLIQMQDALVNFSNDANYGANDPFSGPDRLGGTGYLDLGNSGKYEYIVATNSVSLDGGLLTFRGMGVESGTINEYTSAGPTVLRGSRSFQVIRVPQYANLQLDPIRNNIIVPKFNGQVGGVLAFNVAGIFDLNGDTIDVSALGFLGGQKGRYFETGDGYYNRNDVYAQFSIRDSPYRYSGKANGIAGSPGYGFPLGPWGKGAPANAGGAGNINLAGGGGGGNAGAGGVGGNGRSFGDPRDSFPNGGRPGSNVYDHSSAIDRLIPGGGGGGADLDLNNISYAEGILNGGAVVLINADHITGAGAIRSSGLFGNLKWSNDPEDFNPLVSGAGGGAGGTIFINELHGDLPANVIVEAKGGNGWSTAFRGTVASSTGPGGGGGGGQIFSSMIASRIRTDVSKGKAGRVNGTNETKSAADGQDGNVRYFRNNDLPPHLRYGICFPELMTTVSQSDVTARYYAGEQVIYTIRITNVQQATVSGVKLALKLPLGFSFVRANASYTGDANGPEVLNDMDTTNARLILGDFILFSGDEVLIRLIAKIDCEVSPGTYHVSAQALFPDPLRLAAHPDRLVTPLINAFPNTFTSYEGASTVVEGENYNGNLPASAAEDVVVIAPVVIGNLIQAPQSSAFCLEGKPGSILGHLPSGGVPPYSYQWQQSANGMVFTNILAATAESFEPPLLTDSVYYRRNVFMLGCSNPINSSNVVLMKVLKPLPVPDFLVPDVCLKDATGYFKNTTTVEDAAFNRLSYNWDFGDAQSSVGNPNTSTEKDGSHVYTKTGYYTITLKVSRDGACPQIIQKSFRVNGSLPKADFMLLGNAFCSGQELMFEDKASVDFGEITRIEWYFNDQNSDQVVIDIQPEKREAAARIYKYSYPAFHSPATKTIRVRMVVYSGLSCSSEQIKDVVLQASPELSFDPIPSVCRNTPAFELTQGKEIWGIVGSGKYSGVGVNEEGWFNPEQAGQGNHIIKYVFTAENGCVVEKSQPLTVLAVPEADAGGNLSVLEGGSVQLAMDAKKETAGLSYKWSPAIFLDRDDVLNPLCSPGSDQTYVLTVTNAEGCSSKDEMRISVMKNPLIPNTFTPNGDGINDEWQIIYLESYPKATIRIFNRYGEKVFNGNAKSKSWDGKYDGQDVPVGTYYYVIDPHNGRKVISGSVTILR